MRELSPVRNRAPTGVIVMKANEYYCSRAGPLQNVSERTRQMLIRRSQEHPVTNAANGETAEMSLLTSFGTSETVPAAGGNKIATWKFYNGEI